MIRTGWLSAFALAALSPLTSFGQYSNGMGGGGMGGMAMGGAGMVQGAPRDSEEWTVKIETLANQAVTGKLKLATVAVQCDLGLYEIKPEKIKELQFAPIAKETPFIVGVMGGQRDAVVMTASGEKIAGTVAIPQWWRVRTELGMLTPDAQRIKSITFVARVEPESGQASKPNGGQPAANAAQPSSNKPGSGAVEPPK